MSDAEATVAEMRELEAEASAVLHSHRSNFSDDSDMVSSHADANIPGKLHTEKSKYAAFYKCNSLDMTQKTRREKLLEEMKERRQEVVNEKRGLFRLLNWDTADEVDTHVQVDFMDVENSEQSEDGNNPYCMRLMLSEWFTDIPEDLESQWLVKFCPVGSRRLVVANWGFTRDYDLRGERKFQFFSELPGGNDRSNFRSTTILDCIFNRMAKRYYVLDSIAWDGVSTTPLDSQNRFITLKSDLCSKPTLQKKRSYNTTPFIELPDYPAKRSIIAEVLSQPYKLGNKHAMLDGLLFYHKDAQYIMSSTPLVGWLKPFMVPEMLGVPVHKWYMTCPNYQSMQQYMEYWAQQRQDRAVYNTKVKKSEETHEEEMT